MSPTAQSIRSALQSVQDPATERGIVATGQHWNSVQPKSAEGVTG